jgi:hypothetical protein
VRFDQGYALGRFCIPLEQGQNLGGGDLSKRFGVLVDCGDRVAQGGSKGMVAATDDRDVLGNAQAGSENGFHRTDGEGIVEAENAIDAGLDLEKALGGFEAVMESARAGFRWADDVVIVGAETGGFEGTFVALEAAKAGAHGRTADVPDVFTALRDEVLGGHAAEEGVISPDEWRLDAIDFPDREGRKAGRAL